MPSKPNGMLWYTCTPKDFGGGPDFFARDSGLLCRGFQALGMASRAVMPLSREQSMTLAGATLLLLWRAA